MDRRCRAGRLGGFDHRVLGDDADGDRSRAGKADDITMAGSCRRCGFPTKGFIDSGGIVGAHAGGIGAETPRAIVRRARP